MLRRISGFTLATVVLLCGCGKQGEDAGGDENSSRGPDPCALLSAAQVTTVLPDSDGGYAAMRGGSLVKGVDSYQCSYSDPTSNTLLLIFHTADTAAHFDDIKPKNPSWAVGEKNVQRVNLGDSGWLQRNEHELKLEASHGRLVIQLSLDAPDALEKEGALIALGQALLDALVDVPAYATK